MAGEDSGSPLGSPGAARAGRGAEGGQKSPAEASGRNNIEMINLNCYCYALLTAAQPELKTSASDYIYSGSLQ